MIGAFTFFVLLSPLFGFIAGAFFTEKLWIWGGLFVLYLFSIVFAGYRFVHDRKHIHSYLRRLESEIEQETKLPASPRLLTQTGRELLAYQTRMTRAWRQKLFFQKQLEQTYTALTDALPDPIILLSQDRVVTYANPAAHALFPGRLLHRPLAEILRFPEVFEAIDRAIRSGEMSELSCHFVTSERHFDCRVQPLGNQETGLPQALLLSFHDVTSRKYSDQMRTDFVANASHELRTPLATLSGFVETLLGPAKDDPAAAEKFLPIIQNQLYRMRRLVEDLLSLSRIEDPAGHAPHKRVDIQALMQHSTELLHSMAQTRQINLDVKLSPALPMIWGDKDQIYQLLQNLVDNALTYGHQGGCVRLYVDVYYDAWLGKDFLRLRVSDYGEGIAREHLSRLTERFYRVDPARSRLAGGTGLGLAIVKHIIHHHKGRLMIDSVQYVGSCFTVLLPALEEPILEPQIKKEDPFVKNET